MTAAFDDIDGQLLELIQRGFSLVSRPFDAIGDKLGISGSEVMERVSKLKRDGIIRQISAIFDSAALGYQSELVAFKTEPASLESIALVVSLHKGVSHCYSRDADYNLWFTITVGPGEDMSGAIEMLSKTSDVMGFIRLPQKRLFKIGVFLDVTGRNASKLDLTGQNPPESARNLVPLDPEFRPYVRVLQKTLPITPTPFFDLAEAANMTESELLSAAKELLSNAIMRRFAAVLKHVIAGFKVNAMICWSAPQNEIEKAGSELAKHPSVSHCYERSISHDWPWPLYTMVHCRTEAELDQVISELKAASSLTEYRVLKTLKEFKKSRVTYFD